MPLPTWNGEPVDEGSLAMMAALDQASEVLREAIGGVSLTDRPAQDLLHAIEAAAWLERLSEAGRHILVPMAKANGASWAQLAAAMGVSRATAQHRYQQGVKDWEESVRSAAEPPPWEGVEPLSRMDPPANFSPSDEHFVRMANLPAWNYTGPLEPAIQYIRAHHENVLVYSHEGVHYVSSKQERRSTSTSADSEEQAWRAHLGLVLSEGQPFPDDARPGESIATFKARLQQEPR